jgi:hypothetical protein
MRGQKAKLLEQRTIDRAYPSISSQNQGLDAQLLQAGIRPTADPYRLQALEGDVLAAQNCASDRGTIRSR